MWKDLITDPTGSEASARRGKPPTPPVPPSPLRLLDDPVVVPDTLADLIAARLPGLIERWETAALGRVEQLTPEQRRAVAAAIHSFAPAYVHHLRSQDEAPLAEAARAVAQAGLFRLLSLEQLQMSLGCFHQVVWPLVVLHAGGDVSRLVAAAEVVAECALGAARAATSEYERRVVSEANDTIDFGFTLAAVTRSVTATLNLDEVLRVACEEGARLMGVESVLIRLLDENQQLVCRAAWGEHAADLLGTVLPMDHGTGLCGRAVQTRRVQAARACPGTALDSDRLPLRPGQVCLAAPIIAKGEVLGAMLFADRQHEERSESARSTELALTADLLVGQVALMIYNARLHTQVRELAYALDHIGECVLVADTDGRIRYANRAVMTILGYEPDAVVGRSLADLTVGPLAPDLGALTQGKARWRHREGGEVPVALTSAPIPGGPEGQPRLVVLARDITDEKRRAEQEAAHRALLQAKNRELEAFVYTVSHDLRAPLVSVHGLLGLLSTGYGQVLDDAGRHLLRRLNVNTVRMERLISDLLRFSRVGRHLARTQIDPGAVVAEILEDWRARLEARGITVEVAEPLPVVYADPTALRQVLENLLANATKFMEDNPAPRIVVGGEAEGEYAHLYVRDNGIGIAPEYHDKAFEIFQRVHDRPEEIDGTGIGLAIVKKAVEMWGGRVWLESAVGQGCTVHFLAPGKEDGHDDGCHGEDAAD